MQSINIANHEKEKENIEIYGHTNPNPQTAALKATTLACEVLPTVSTAKIEFLRWNM